MTAQPRKEPRLLGSVRPDWRPDLADPYQGKAPAMLDTGKQRSWPKPKAVPRPAAKAPKPTAKPFPPHRRPESLAVLPVGFGAVLRAARRASGMTARVVAMRAEMADQTLYTWEAAKGAIRVERDRLARLCRVLGVELP